MRYHFASMIPGIEQRQLVARDGTQLGYQIRGPVGAPCVLLANGLGGTYIAFLRHVSGESPEPAHSDEAV